MNKKYKFEKIMYDRYAVWYMDIPNNKSKLGVWRVIDLYPGTRPTRFAFKWRVKGKEKTQEQLNDIILNNLTRNFYKGGDRDFASKTKVESA